MTFSIILFEIVRIQVGVVFVDTFTSNPQTGGKVFFVPEHHIHQRRQRCSSPRSHFSIRISTARDGS